jgi:arylsulfatase A-like enzyme
MKQLQVGWVRSRIWIGALWAGGIVLPDLVARGLPEFPGSIVYLLAVTASLVLWTSTVEGLAWLRARRPTLALSGVGLLAIFLPLWVAATVRYYSALHQGFPPSAVCFFLRNPRYSYTLAIETTTRWHRLLIIAGWLGLAFLLERLTARPQPKPAAWLRHTRLAGLAAVVLLLIVPKAARSADLEGLRSTLGGVGLWISTKPHLDKPQRVRPSPSPAPVQRPNVVLLIQESLGAWQWSPWNGKSGSSPKIEELLQKDGQLARWFPRATTAAGATAVSLPTILTGLEPNSPGEAFTRAPLVWQEARVLGYATALFSAEDYDWMNFRTFFLGAEGPDVAKVAADLGPRVNDNGVDDAEVAVQAERYIDAVPPEKPFLVIVQFNATHRPCWAPGVTGEGMDRVSTPLRCLKAARYVDAASVHILDHLRATGRLESTFVLGTADHGETFRDDRPPRLESYFEDVTRVPLWLRVPQSYVSRNPGALAQVDANTHERVSNVDIYPTLLDLWGRWPLQPGERPRLGGQSLLRPIDRDRSLVVVNTGEIHDFNWSNEGFAVYHRQWKWLCDEYRGCRLFDIFADPAELNDLLGRAPATELARFKSEIGRNANLRRILSKAAPDML